MWTCRLTVLAVDAVEAGLTLADILAEDVASARVARQLADAVVPAGVGVARPFGNETNKERGRIQLQSI